LTIRGLHWRITSPLDILAQRATIGLGRAASSERGGRNVHAMAMAPTPIPHDPMHSQAELPNASDSPPPASGPSAMLRVDAKPTAPKVVPMIRAPKYSRTRIASRGITPP
jgi:hypothetical protein